MRTKLVNLVEFTKLCTTNSLIYFLHSIYTSVSAHLLNRCFIHRMIEMLRRCIVACPMMEEDMCDYNM